MEGQTMSRKIPFHCAPTPFCWIICQYTCSRIQFLHSALEWRFAVFHLDAITAFFLHELSWWFPSLLSGCSFRATTCCILRHCVAVRCCYNLPMLWPACILKEAFYLQQGFCVWSKGDQADLLFWCTLFCSGFHIQNENYVGRSGR